MDFELAPLLMETSGFDQHVMFEFCGGELVGRFSSKESVDVGRLHYPLLPVRLLLSYRYDSVDKVPLITCPKLFFHGEDDSLIPIENGRKLFDAAAEPKQFITTPGDHNESGFTYSTEFTNRLEAFLETVLPRSLNADS